MKICDYECGKKAEYQLKNGKWCCEKDYRKCLGIRKRNSEAHKGKIPSKETRKKISEVMRGKNKGKIPSKETRKKSSKAQKFTLKDYKEKYPFLFKVEELRENPETGEIQGHCKYNECENSKEKGGWFILTYTQIYERLRALNSEGFKENYFYCSDKCKQECCLYNLRSDPNTQSEFKKYSTTVHKETNETVKEFSDEIKNIKLRGQKFGYELDHKYSIFDGFTNNVEPKTVSHWTNLQVLPMIENRSKHKKSTISLNELLTQIKQSSC